MRIAVAGGTGLVGRRVTEALLAAGHEPAVLSRSHGVDLASGDGLAGALAGCDAVVDVTNTPAQDAAETTAFFAAVTGNLLAAERAAGVARHLLLSIVGLDRIRENAHYLGKRAQEQAARRSSAAVTILRATQFHEFAAMVVEWTRQDGEASVPPLLVQPVAAADVASALVELAADAGAGGGVVELAGPRTEDLVDMARRTLAACGETLRLVPGWGGPFGVEMAGETLLPGPDARIAPTSFDEWLDQGAGRRPE